MQSPSMLCHASLGRGSRRNKVARIDKTMVSKSLCGWALMLATAGRMASVRYGQRLARGTQGEYIKQSL